MTEIIEFPKKKGIKKEEVDNIIRLVQEAINTHEVLREYANKIKSDPRLKSVNSEVILKSLTLMLKNKE